VAWFGAGGEGRTLM